MMIAERVRKLLSEIPPYVEVVAAVKGRTAEEIIEAIEGGIKIIGENYVQEAERVYKAIGKAGEGVQWHFIGHLQKNKVKKAVEMFDVIQTVDSYELAAEIDKRCRQINKIMPVLVEVNSGREEQKFGVFPEDVEHVVRSIAPLQNIKVVGLMTMGPLTDDIEVLRKCFIETREIYKYLQNKAIENVTMKYLSMGMSSSYRVAIEEGANMIRIGTLLFGPRVR
jgi:pyridoxal phosphate enzyme (YggS family)